MVFQILLINDNAAFFSSFCPFGLTPISNHFYVFFFLHSGGAIPSVTLIMGGNLLNGKNATILTLNNLTEIPVYFTDEKNNAINLMT